MSGNLAENPWPADQVERRAVGALIPYARNARKHSDAQIAEIAGSIREWGWTIPVLIDESERIIAGHGRVLAAHKLAIPDVPVMVARGWSEAQKQAYTLADNQIALHGTWDLELLRVELSDLREQAVDLATLGFSLDEVRAYVGGGGDDAADEVPPTPEPDKVRSKAGEVWQLGRHRLICGDATDAQAVAKLMQGEQAAICFTSPPYAQQRQYGVRTPKDADDWTGLMRGAFGGLPVAPGGQVLVNLGLIYRDHEWVAYWNDWLAWMRGEGWRAFGWYVWDRGAGMPGSYDGRLAPAFEFVFHFNRASFGPRKTKQKAQGRFRLPSAIGRNPDDTKHQSSAPASMSQPTKIPDSVIRVQQRGERLTNGIDHPAVFPVALAEEMLTAFSEEGAIAFEPFAGAGTQIIAAERVNRTCYAVEINPAYCDVILERWRRVTGDAASRVGGRKR